MTHLFKTVFSAAAITLAALSANTATAQDIPVPRLKPSPYLELHLAEAERPMIGIARIEDGRLAFAPANELRDWAAMSIRIDENVASFMPISPVKLAAFTPQTVDSANKIDEIRLAAADAGMSYVIIYGRDKDAMWNSFGRQKLDDTGLYVPAGHRLSAKGQVKALIVGTYSGTVYGTVTSNDTKYGLDEFTHRVEDIVTGLPTREAPEDLI